MRIPMLIVWWDSEKQRAELQIVTVTQIDYNSFAIAGAALAAAQYFNSKVKFPAEPSSIEDLLRDVEKGLDDIPPQSP